MEAMTDQEIGVITEGFAFHVAEIVVGECAVQHAVEEKQRATRDRVTQGAALQHNT